ncbi:hypothetical protein MPSEU_000310400 [Mayamaea pseudoterrestris]|nr:hypothetical protein MPSEU_000310400 [Mayamaea pseudoterrestris]
MQAFVLKQQQEIESSRIQLAVALAGGGSHFLSTLTSTPASRLLGAATMRRAVYLTAKGDKLHVPSIVQVSTAPQASSQDITTRMGQSMGIAMTSKLQSTSKWPSRAYVVVERQNGPSLTIEATLSSSSARTRLEEDVFVSHMLLTCLEKALNEDDDTLNGNVVKANGKDHDRIVTTDCGDVLAISVPPKIDPQQAVADAIHRILSQGESCVMLIPDYSTSRVIGSNGNTLHWKPLAAPSLPPKSLVVSGSFNPPHVGHIGLARAALDATTCPTVWFELALTNADKVNDWTVEQVLNRLNGFATLLPDPQTNPFSWGVILTNNAPLFVDKAYLLDPLQAKSKLKRLAGQEQLHFVIGTDTLVRMVDPKYYDNSRDEMLDTLARMPCRFVVGGRLQQNKDANNGQLEVFVTGKEQVDELPNELKDKFVLLPHFRMDISSTELRKRMAAIGKGNEAQRN